MSSVAQIPHKKILYLYLDEGGNLDYSSNGTRFFTLTTVACLGEPTWANALKDLKAELVAGGVDFPYFHATENKQDVRDRVFEIIRQNLPKIFVDSLIVEKAKTGPALQDHVQFYSRMIFYLLRFRMKNLNPFTIEKIRVITDTLPANKKKRRAIEKAIKEQLAKIQLWNGMSYEVVHDLSRNHPMLQIADYCNWAVYRKWSRNDLRSYSIIQTRISSEFDIFRTGTRYYY